VSKGGSSGARSRAREVLVQLLYQKQITGHDLRELRSQVKDRKEYNGVDQQYFDDALAEICGNIDAIGKSIDEFADRPYEHLDPIEKSILLLGFYELQSVPDVPYRVVINESVNLAKRFGAEDGYKYVNALLDRASKKLRPEEHG
jgi:N utilization substance protein B